MTPATTSATPVKVYMHFFIPGSGERQLLTFLQHNTALLGANQLVYAAHRANHAYAFGSHIGMAGQIYYQTCASTPKQAARYKANVHALFMEMHEACQDHTRLLFSCNCPANAEVMNALLGAWKEQTVFPNVSIKPIFCFTHQEDALEFRQRYFRYRNIQQAPRTFFCDNTLFYYDKIQLFQDAATALGLETEPPEVLWQSGDTDNAGAAFIQTFLQTCGVQIPAQIVIPPAPPRPRGHHALRFAALAFPPADKVVVDNLLAPENILNAFMLEHCDNILAALRKAEEDGVVPVYPGSSSELRKTMAAHAAENNARLLNAFPHLACAMEQPPQYPHTLPDFPTEELDAPLIDALLCYLTPTQRSLMLRRLHADRLFLLPEQQLIVERILASLAASSIELPVQNAGVAVLTLTRNHEAYIAQMMDSVLAQHTTFPVEHYIVDDASTDATPRIIEEYALRYPSITPVILRQRSCKGENVVALFSRCRAPYAALCDGDDYFTDPFKLQRQVDFLEQHPDHAVCFHPVRVEYEDNPKRNTIYPDPHLLPGGVRTSYQLDDMFFFNFIQTNTVMYRWRFTHGLPEWFVATLTQADWYWHALHAECGKIGMLPDVMSVYRRHKNALFYSSEMDHIRHRVLHGIAELQLYQTLSEHFAEKYAHRLNNLAISVFEALLLHYVRSGDMTPLNSAMETFPAFANVFMAKDTFRNVLRQNIKK